MNELNKFIKSLKYYNLTKQQRKSLRGQAISGKLEEC